MTIVLSYLSTIWITSCLSFKIASFYCALVENTQIARDVTSIFSLFDMNSKTNTKYIIMEDETSIVYSKCI